MNEGLNLNLGCTLFDYQPQTFNTKSVLITSGTTGIGRETAILLAAQGARVMLSGRREQELNDALRRDPGAAPPQACRAYDTITDIWGDQRAISSINMAELS